MYVTWFQRYRVLNEIQDGRRPPFWIWFSTKGWYWYVPPIDLNIPAKFGKCKLNGSKGMEC